MNIFNALVVTTSLAAIMILPRAGLAEEGSEHPGLGEEAVPSVEGAAQESPREGYRREFARNFQELGGIAKDLTTLVKRFEDMPNNSVESRKAEFEEFRTKLATLGTQLSNNGPVAKAVDGFSAWLSAQVARVNGERATLGGDFVEKLLAKYKEDQAALSDARALLSKLSTDVDRTSQDMTVAELRFSELLLADDVDGAIKELVAVLQRVDHLIKNIRDQAARLGDAGV